MPRAPGQGPPPQGNYNNFRQNYNYKLTNQYKSKLNRRKLIEYGSGEGKQISPFRHYFDTLFNSDIKLEDLDQQLRIWVGQLVENSIHMQAKKIEVRLIMQGKLGFDIIDDGFGIPESEFDDLCKCEALSSLSRCSELKVITKFHNSSTGYEIVFQDGEIQKCDKIQKDRQGTIVCVRNIHNSNPSAQGQYRKLFLQHYANALSLLNDFSLILYKITLILSNEFVNKNNNARTIRHFWQTHGPGDQRKNLDTILNNYYSKSPFCATPNELTYFETTINQFKIIVYLVRPYTNGIQRPLTKKTMHYFFNHKPAEIPAQYKTVFYDLYHEFKVNPRSLPFVFLHFICEDHNAYQIVNQLDLRIIKFPAESTFLAMMKTQVRDFFRSMNRPMPASYNIEQPNMYDAKMENEDGDQMNTQDPFSIKHQPLKNLSDPRQREEYMKNKMEMMKKKMGGIVKTVNNEFDEEDEENQGGYGNYNQNSNHMNQNQSYGMKQSPSKQSTLNYRQQNYNQGNQVKSQQPNSNQFGSISTKQEPYQNQNQMRQQNSNYNNGQYNNMQNQNNRYNHFSGSIDENDSTNSTTPQSFHNVKNEPSTQTFNPNNQVKFGMIKKDQGMNVDSNYNQEQDDYGNEDCQENELLVFNNNFEFSTNCKNEEGFDMNMGMGLQENNNDFGQNGNQASNSTSKYNSKQIQSNNYFSNINEDQANCNQNGEIYCDQEQLFKDEENEGNFELNICHEDTELTQQNQVRVQNSKQNIKSSQRSHLQLQNKPDNIEDSDEIDEDIIIANNLLDDEQEVQEQAEDQLSNQLMQNDKMFQNKKDLLMMKASQTQISIVDSQSEPQQNAKQSQNQKKSQKATKSKNSKKNVIQQIQIKHTKFQKQQKQKELSKGSQKAKYSQPLNQESQQSCNIHVVQEEVESQKVNDIQENEEIQISQELSLVNLDQNTDNNIMLQDQESNLQIQQDENILNKLDAEDQEMKLDVSDILQLRDSVDQSKTVYLDLQGAFLQLKTEKIDCFHYTVSPLISKLNKLCKSGKFDKESLQNSKVQPIIKPLNAVRNYLLLLEIDEQISIAQGIADQNIYFAKIIQNSRQNSQNSQESGKSKNLSQNVEENKEQMEQNPQMLMLFMILEQQQIEQSDYEQLYGKYGDIREPPVLQEKINKDLSDSDIEILMIDDD
eukprot:403375275